MRLVTVCIQPFRYIYLIDKDLEVDKDLDIDVFWVILTTLDRYKEKI
jgi:hypothetical protein